MAKITSEDVSNCISSCKAAATALPDNEDFDWEQGVSAYAAGIGVSAEALYEHVTKEMALRVQPLF